MKLPWRRRPQRPSNRGRGNTFVGILIGLVLGLVVAAGIAVYMMKSPLPFVSRSKAGDKASPVEPLAKARVEAKGDTLPADRDNRGEKPKLEFHKVLPAQPSQDPAGGGERGGAAPDTRRGDQTAAIGKAPELTRDAYVIQAGSFQNPADADNLKAKLALIGVEAAIEPVSLPDKGTWYRVRLGPYRSLGEINDLRSRLARAGVDGQLIKLRE